MTEHTKDAGGLLPCPFCGAGNASVFTEFDPCHYICCNDCYAQSGESSEADAIAAWNRRAPTPEAAALILAKEALAALVDEYCDYATTNHLGDPERQHNIKRARTALGAIKKLGVE